MLNLIRKFLRPTLREQLEAGVREALRRYADRRTAPDLRVYVSEDLVGDGLDPALWARDEADHLRRFAVQWAEDNGIARAGLRLEVILLDTKREFAFVKPLGVEPRAAAAQSQRLAGNGGSAAEAAGEAELEVVDGPGLGGPLRVRGEITLGRATEPGIVPTGDRYMSARHARLRVEGGRLWVTDLDSKNRTFVNDEPLPPHRPSEAGIGDLLRMGTTTLRVAKIGG